jgi:hypothetical protein
VAQAFPQCEAAACASERQPKGSRGRTPSDVTGYDTRVPKRSRKRPRDVNELASEIVREATGDKQPASEQPDTDEGKDPAAVALGRRGGLKGGRARAERMTAEERGESARRAAEARLKRNKT